MAAMAAVMSASMMPAAHTHVMSFHGGARVCILRGSIFNCQTAEDHCRQQRYTERKSFHILAP